MRPASGLAILPTAQRGRPERATSAWFSEPPEEEEAVPMALGDSPQRPRVERRRARDQVDDAAELLPGVAVLTKLAGVTTRLAARNVSATIRRREREREGTARGVVWGCGRRGKKRKEKKSNNREEEKNKKWTGARRRCCRRHCVVFRRRRLTCRWTIMK